MRTRLPIGWRRMVRLDGCGRSLRGLLRRLGVVSRGGLRWEMIERFGSGDVAGMRISSTSIGGGGDLLLSCISGTSGAYIAPQQQSTRPLQSS